MSEDRNKGENDEMNDPRVHYWNSLFHLHQFL
jgi:hypothetical protein